MFYFIYQTTNQVNGKIYVGKHKTENLDDGYLGSGRNIQLAIRKYGAANFSRSIIFMCENEEELNKKEQEIVCSSFISRSDVYNIAIGGKGGFDHINRYDFNDRKIETSLKNFGVSHPMKHPTVSNRRSETINARYGSDFNKRIRENANKNFCTKHEVNNVMEIPDIKVRHSVALPVNHQKGHNNSQFGKTFKFVNDGNKNRKISITDLGSFLNLGWKLGRI